MATVASKSPWHKKTVRQSAAATNLDAASGPRRKNWRRRILVVGGLLLLLVGTLPMIVANTPLRNQAVGLLATDLNGEIHCDSASLGWFSPAVLQGVTIIADDDQKTVLVDGATITTSKGLLGLVFSNGQFGQIQIQRPQLHFSVRADGSDLEDLLAPLLTAKNADTDPISIAVEITDAKITIDDTVSGKRFVFDDTNVSFVMSQDPAEPMHLAASANTHDGKHAGRVAIDLTLGDSTGDSTSLTITSEDLSIGSFASLLRRVDPQFSTTGRLTCQVDAQWNMAETKPSISARGKVLLSDVDLTASALGSDRVQLNRFSGPFDLSWANDRLQVNGLDLQCDLGTLNAHGKIDLKEFNWTALRDALSETNAEVSISLDLARAATMLPETLRMKKTVQLNSGKIELTIVGSGENPHQIGEAKIFVSHLHGLSNGRILKWERPLKLILVLREDATGRPTGQLVCKSNFLDFKASGTVDQVTGAVQFDVGRLAAELGQFVDLEALELSGRGDGSFNWHCNVDGLFGAFASLSLRDFRLTGTAGRTWQEDHLKAEVNATGMFAQGILQSVYSGKLDLESSGEQVSLRLADRVFDLDEFPNWPLKFRFVGNLANWADRLSLWVDLGDTQIAGLCELSSDLVVTDGDIRLSRLSGKIAQLVCRGDGWNIYEPDVRLDVVGKWTAVDRQMVISQAAIKSNALAVNAQDLSITMPASGSVSVAGLASYQANLARIQSWFADPHAKPTTTIEGILGGQIKADWRHGELNFETQSDAENVRLVQWTRQPGNRESPQVIWTEPKSRLIAQAKYSPQQDTLDLQRLEFVSPGTLQLIAKGKVTELSDRMLSDLSGNINYDLERLSLLLQPWLGSQVQFKGTGPRDFFIKGPLAEIASLRTTLVAQGEIGWDSGNIFGMAVGQGELKIGTDRGIVNIAPIDLQLSEGRLTLAPAVRNVKDQIFVVFPKGPVLSKVRLTPKMCAAAMKYIHPFLAGATHVDGHVSLDLEHAWIPLDAPHRARLAGQLHIHSVQIADGPLARQLLPLLAIPAQRIPLTDKVEFWVDRERVYHRGVGIKVGLITITTRGSVGLIDETLDIVAEMPVPQKWLGNNALGTALRNQVIQIPIGGTLSQPKIDTKKLDQMRARLMRKAAGNLIRDEVLDRFFRP